MFHVVSLFLDVLRLLRELHAKVCWATWRVRMQPCKRSFGRIEGGQWEHSGIATSATKNTIKFWTSDPVCMFCHLRNAWCFLESHSQFWQANDIVSSIQTFAILTCPGAGTYQSSTSTGQESTKPCESVNWSVPPWLGYCEFMWVWYWGRTHTQQILHIYQYLSESINIQHIHSSDLLQW